MLLSIAGGQSQAREAEGGPERFSFDRGWRFIKGDPAGTTTEGLDYRTLKPWLLAGAAELSLNTPAPSRPQGNPGSQVSYVQPSFDDSTWRLLNLPHDWGIEGPFNQAYPGDTGKLPWWGVAWYRKHFTVPASDAGKEVYLDVDGAMAYASVWLNGYFVGGWPYGYSSWRVDLSSHIRSGAENVIAIRLDNPPDSSRWYPGGGIYRNVWLVTVAPVHVAHWGDYITTPQVTPDAATVKLELKLENNSAARANLDVRTAVYELNEAGERAFRPVTTLGPTGLALGAGANGTVVLTGVISRPRLWSLRHPNRYVAVSTIAQDGSVVDTCKTSFGVRKIQFTADNGFLLNGERVPLNGVCDHHDLGALGTAINTRALERQLQLLQEMGCNAIRTSHNPPAPELLDLCDRMGLVVMDEAFDCWLRGKRKNDYHRLFADWHEKDLRALVRRDRNHPCVVLWSIGNEIPEQGSTNGVRIAHELASIVHSEDPTRPVTSACNNFRAGFNGFQKQLDVFGYNYKPTGYGRFRDANPDEPIFGSETASCVSSRGEYFFPVSNDKSQGKADFQVSSYDLYAPPWATPPDTEFRGQDEFPFVAGEFVWTGFDYLGEPTPYGSDSRHMLNFTDPAVRARMEQELRDTGKILVPSRSSYFGIIDLAGFKKDRFYLYQARWRPELRMAHILPHWNWPERVGQVTPVHVYTSGDEAELFLNGKSLGRKTRGPTDYRLRWDDVVYEPGKLSVIAYKHGLVWARDSVETAGPASKLLLRPDRARIDADGRDLSFVTCTIADSERRQVPRANNEVSFEVSGPGEIAAVDNGDPTSLEPFQANQHKAFNGLCLVIIRSTGAPGEILLKANATDLKPAEVKIEAVQQK